MFCALRKWAGQMRLEPVTVFANPKSLQSWHMGHVDRPLGPATSRARWHEMLAKIDLMVVYVLGRLNTVADCLRPWAYPASKGLARISMNGDETHQAKAKRIIELVERLERGDAPSFVVMAQPTRSTHRNCAVPSA